MDFISFLVLLILFIIIYTIIVEIFTVLLRMMGMTAEKARTQVISMLTNCGYTTSESEMVLSSRRRRRLAHIIILSGYSFSVIIVSVLVNLFLALKSSEVRTLLPLTLLLLASMIACLLIMRLPPIRSWFDQCIERMSSRVLYGRNRNLLILIDTYNKMSMFEAVLEHIPPILEQVPLGQSRLKEDHQIQILSVTRHGAPEVNVDGDCLLQTGDVLILFGDSKKIRMLFGRPV